MLQLKASVRKAVLFSLVLGAAFAGQARAAEEPATDAADRQETQEKQTSPRLSGKKTVAPRAKTPTSKPSKTVKKAKAKPKSGKLPEAANGIVQELRKEFELGKLRTKSDYLKEPKAEITDEVIVTMLQRRLGTNNSMDGYIKWQLLSGLPKELPEALVGDVVVAYQNAPGLQPRPGMSEEEKKALDREAKRVDDPAALTGRLIDEGRRVDLLNEPIMKYRDALFARLPDTYDVLLSGLQDAYHRAETAASARSHVALTLRRINKWSDTASEQEVSEMLGVVEELMRTPTPTYYDTLKSNRDAGGFTWESRRTSLNENRQLNELAESLEKRLGRESENADEGKGGRSRKR